MRSQDIIVPLEWTPRSLRALKAARVLAEQTGRKLHLVSVIPAATSSDERRRAMERAAHDYGLKSPHITILNADLVSFAVGAQEGSLWRLIAESPDAWICMSTHARNAIGDMLLGSVASEILDRAERPVVLTGPRFSADWNGPIKMLLVCLDGSRLSEAIIGPAADLAKSMGADLSLVQVQKPHASRIALSHDPLDPGYVQHKAAGVKKTHGIQPYWDVLHGKDPARALTEYVSGYPSAMIAMTTHGHTGLRKLAFGSVTRDVVHGAYCPVLVLRPTAEG